MQPKQTHAVDQSVARGANGYKAEGFSRQRVFIVLWAFRIGAGRDSERRVQPRQTDSDAVDQSAAREGNGYKAEGFSRQRVFRGHDERCSASR